jgi:hypothetical protein
MKTFLVLAVSIVLVSIFFCPMVMAFPTMPADLQIVQPDPSLPKELSAFFGKWEGNSSSGDFFVIVEKIDEEKASLYVSQKGFVPELSHGWERIEAKVIKEGRKYKLWYSHRLGSFEYTLKGERLAVSSPRVSVQLKLVP